MSRSIAIPVALTIAGSDSSGGAGIQADLKTFAARAVHGASVITALTAQNTAEVRGVHAVPPEFVALQLDAVLDDLEVRALKIGMLGAREIVECVAERAAARKLANLVLDPVMVSKSGARLLEPDAVQALKELLLPLATVITPNLPEAAELLGESESDVWVAPQRACERLVALGARAVVLKGGHAGGNYSEDLFFDGANFMRLPARRIESENTHGTGCTLSAAIAAELAKGAELARAVAIAKQFTTEAIAAAADWKLGRAHGPVHHFYAWWPENLSAR